MLNRRQLRVKVLQVLYALSQGNSVEINEANKKLEESFASFENLYLSLLHLLVEVRDYAQYRIDEAKKKNLPTEADLNPNLRFVKNQCFDLIEHDPKFQSYLIPFEPKEDEKPKEKKARLKKLEKYVDWKEQRSFVKSIYFAIRESDLYERYMSREENNLKIDSQFLEDVYIKIIAPSEDLHYILEEQNVFWVDDMPLANSMILKTLAMMYKPDFDSALLPLFKENQDKRFTRDLLENCILYKEQLEELVVEKAQNWEKERIAVLDRLLMEMALCEMLYFPTVPVKVSINEYIELSKDYSTPKSKVFINGVLDKLHKDLKKDNQIKKSGRGLI